MLSKKPLGSSLTYIHILFLLQRVELNLPSLQEKARLKDDIKSIKTIGITIAAYFLCYVPAILYAVVGLQKENLADSWFGFIAWYSLYISSALNPIIYYLRASRCRSAFKQFLKDPFGSSDFKENHSVHRNGGNQRDEVLTKRRSGERGKGGRAFKADSIQYSGERRNAITTSVMQELDADLSSLREAGPGSKYDEVKGKNGGEAGASNSPVETDLCQGKGSDTEEVNDEVPEKCGLKKESRKPLPFSSRKKVHPLEASDMSTETGKPDGRKGELEDHCRVLSLENQRNDLSTGDKFENVVKAAWLTKE